MRPFIPPLLAGVAAGVASWQWAIYPTFDSAAAISFGGSIASIATTMLGFMLAALAVLASINHTHLVKMMRARGYYLDLLATMFFGCILFMACAISGYALLFGVAANMKFLIFVVGLHVAALISLCDVGRKLWLVLSNLREV